MAQNGGYGGINGKDDAKDYAWTGAKGERPAYSKAYADARTDSGNSEYMKNVGKGGLNYDSARMKDEGDAVAARYYRKEHPYKKNRRKTSTKR